MARRPHAPEQLQLLMDETFRPGGGVRVFKSAHEFAAAAPKKKQYKRRDFSAAANRAVEEVEELIKDAVCSAEPEKVWAAAEPGHLVALYSVMHRKVYGELPGELAGDWMSAVSAATKLLKDEFADTFVHAVQYLQWAFAIEKKKEARRTADSSTWRLGWRYALMKRELLTSYRVAVRRGSRAG